MNLKRPLTFKRVPVRIAALAVLAWMAVEIVLFVAATRSVGLLVTLLFMALKGIGGFFLLAKTLRTVFGVAVRQGGRRGLSGAADGIFALIGALLILLPGFLAPLAGLALFSPSVRNSLARRFRRAGRRDARRTILTLDRSEWREVSVRRPRRRARSARSVAP